MRTPGRGPVTRLGAVVLVALVAACGDDGPSGPGTMAATVETGGAAPGGVVLEVTGTGIEGFAAAGSTRLISRTVEAPTDENPTGRYRLVLIGPGDVPLRFDTRVEDIGAAPPSTTVILAVDDANQPIGDLSSFRVAYERR